VASRKHLRAAFEQPGFSRLLGIRVAGQFGDGVFQASLAGAVLFSPEHQASAADIASGFAVLLLPYSVLAPFAGVLLDRWWRQRVLTIANLVRAIAVIGLGVELGFGVHGQPLYVSALVVVSVNRFVLSALSASLPHVVGTELLVTANAFTTTVGSIATTAGAAAAIGVRNPLGAGDAAYATIAIAATVPYLIASVLARGFERTALGPDEAERGNRETVGEVLRGLAAGVRHLVHKRPALYALVTITTLRFCFGITTVCTLLLFRNYYVSDGVFRAGLAGLAQVTVVLAAGAGVAALVTPAAARRLGMDRWPVILLAVAAVTMIAFWLPYELALVLPGVFVIAFVGQGVKICVDTVIQASIEDSFRGRVFTAYDTMVNVAFVAAAVVIAWELPESGHAPAAFITVAAVCGALAAGYWWLSSRLPGSERAVYSANQDRSAASAASAPSGP
jgi:MFS family permease